MKNGKIEKTIKTWNKKSEKAENKNGKTRNNEKFEGLKKLEKNSIGSAVYYPVSLEKQKAYTEVYSDKAIYKNSNYLSSSCLSLPMYPHLSEDEVHKTCEVIKNIKWLIWEK